MSESESIYGNICSLINIYEKAQTKSNASPWTTSVLPRDEENGAKPRRSLRKLAFEKLLFCGQEAIQVPLEITDSLEPSSAVQVEFSVTVYGYRVKRQFDKANALEENFEALKILHSSNGENFPYSIVKLLLLLKQTSSDSSPKLGELSERVVESADTVPRFFPASIMYGDSKYEAPFQKKSYEQFPSYIFDISSLPKDESSCNLFNAPPGTQLRPVWNPLSAEIEAAQRSLFGALSKPPSTLHGMGLIHSSFILDIPALSHTDDSGRPGLGFNTLALKKEEALLCDEGYVSPSPTPTKSSSLTEEISQEACDWELIARQDFMKPCRKTWECLGQGFPTAELAYISEAGPEAVSRLYAFIVNQHKVIDSSYNAAIPRIVSEPEIWRHIQLLCLGISSSSFEYRNDFFQIVAGITVQTLTPDCMASWIQIFLDSGRLHRHLWQVAHSSRNAMITPGAQNRRGFVFQAFQDQILRYLEFYQESLVNNFERLNFSSAIKFVESLVTPLRICYDVDCQMQQKWAPHQSVLNFLVLLVEQLELTIEEEAKVILTSLLQACATPLLNFVKNWAWRGLCHDPHSEFWIRLKPEYLACRDRRLWNHGFVQVDGQPYVDIFREFQRITFECGKTLTLLRILNPKHDLVANAYVPDLDFVLTPEQCYQQSLRLDQYEKYWIEKGAVWALWIPSDLRSRSREASVGLNAVLGREATMKRIQEEKTEKRSIMAAKKRVKQERIASSLGEALAQKREAQRLEREEEKVEDEKRENVIEEQEMKKINEKGKIVEKYAKLLRESEKTEERALWLLRRRNLSEQRNEFLRKTHFEDENQNPFEAEPPSMMTSSDIANQNAEDVLDNARLKDPLLGSEELREIMTQSDIANQNFAPDLESPAFDSSEDPALDRAASFSVLPCELNKRKVLGVGYGIAFSPASAASDFSVQSCDKREADPISPVVPPEKLELVTQHVQEIVAPVEAEKIEETLEEPPSATPVLEKDESNECVSSQEVCQGLLVNNVDEKQPVSDRAVECSNSWMKDLYKVAELPMKNVFQSSVQSCKKTELVCVNKLGILPWSVLLEKSLLNAVKTQSKLVNRALLHSLLEEHKLFKHFDALKAFMLMYEANFGDSLASKLAAHVEQSSHRRSLYNIPALTSILSGAIASACPSEFADNLSFEISHVPEAMSLENSRIVNFVTLRYLVTWPQNLILTDSVCSQYSYISSSLLEIRYALWALSDVMQHLNHKGTTARLQKSRQFLQLHIARHKMDHFVRSFHMYLAHELLDVQWGEFMKKLESDVQSLDEVYIAHSRFVALAVNRCLLNQEAKPALEILRQGLTLVLRFRRLIIESTWVEDEECKHPRFDDIMKCHKEWEECANLFFLVVQKLMEQGYSELKKLVVILGFNNYYTSLA